MKLYPSARHSCYFYAQLATRSLVWALNYREQATRQTHPLERKRHRDLMRYCAKSWREHAEKARREEAEGYEFMPRWFWEQKEGIAENTGVNKEASQK